MRPAHRLLGFAVAVVSLTACSEKGYDQMKLITEQVGEVPVSDVLKPPANVGDITTWRTQFPGQIFAAVKLDGHCPRDIHTIAGVDYKKDRIELCWTGTPRAEPVPGFACSREVYVKYEIMRMPADVEPNFVFVGSCI